MEENTGMKGQIPDRTSDIWFIEWTALSFLNTLCECECISLSYSASLYMCVYF